MHGYAAIDLEIVWNITQKELPRLKMEIEKLLGGAEAEPSDKDNLVN
ncbi:MAG: DUF86 domain-containing protein [Acidobacteria bacterium]|nr:DUF86 domain-containing protein [Acidobacteriota bacterium]